jgi:hypothetical protein
MPKSVTPEQRSEILQRHRTAKLSVLPCSTNAFAQFLCDLVPFRYGSSQLHRSADEEWFP